LSTASTDTTVVVVVAAALMLVLFDAEQRQCHRHTDKQHGVA
jgi:hypothetical protein